MLSQMTQPHFPRHAVLLVEDDPDIRDAMRQLLEEEGYRVFCAQNGQEALALLREIPRPSVAVLDLMMPVMNGWELICALKRDSYWSRMPLVAVSAAGERLRPPGVAAFISKPVNIGLLLDVIRGQCDNQLEAGEAAHP